MTDGETSLLRRFRNWLIQEPEKSEVDTDYLKEDLGEYKYFTVKPDEEKVRCDLCGKLLPLSKMSKMFSHLSEADEKGSAEIDPFEESKIVAKADYSDLSEDFDDYELEKQTP